MSSERKKKRGRRSISVSFCRSVYGPFVSVVGVAFVCGCGHGFQAFSLGHLARSVSAAGLAFLEGSWGDAKGCVKVLLCVSWDLCA